MDRSRIAELAAQLSRGSISLDDFLRELARPKTADLGDVQLDLDRRERCGFPEVVFGEGKSLATLERIFERLLADGADVLATRIAAERGAALLERFPHGRYNQIARTFRISLESTQDRGDVGIVAVVAAGTTDLPVAEEAAETARWMGAAVTLIVDVGVAGPQRLQSHLDEIRSADAVVVVAGMEGAAERRRRLCGRTGDCGAHERRLRCEFRRNGRAAEHAQ